MATPQANIPQGNSAPLKPLLQLRDGLTKTPEHPIQKAIQKRFEHYNRQNSETWNEMYRVAQMTALYCQGDQIPRLGPFTGTWGTMPLNRAGNSTKRAINLLRIFVSSLLTKWGQSTPDIIVRPGRNLDQCVSAAKAGKAIADYYERMFYEPWFSVQEALLAMQCGTYINRIRYDNTKESMSVMADIFEQKEVSMGQGFAVCGECGEGGPVGGQCPKCGRPMSEIVPQAQGMMQSVSGQEKHVIGDLVCEQLPFYGCRWDLNKKAEDSSWFIYRRRVPLGSITKVLGNVKIPDGTQTDRDIGLDIIQSLAYSGQPVSGRGWGENYRQDVYKDMVSFDEFWMSPDDYADVMIKDGEATVSGETLPGGKLIDIFPDGLVAVGLNGMSVLLDLRAEKHKDHITSGVWHMKSMSGAGQGITDATEVQKRFNTFDNQQMAYWSSLGTPAVLYNSALGLADKAQYLGKPLTNIPIDMRNLPDTSKLSDMIHQFQPGSVPAQMSQYTYEFLLKGFQMTTLATDYASGQPGITDTNTTATAANIDQSNADAINQPIFQVKGQVRKRGAEIVIEQFRKHFPLPRYFALTGKFGQQQGIELSSADIKADLIFEVAKNSELPKGPFQLKQNLMGVMEVFGGVQGLLEAKQAAPRETNEILQAWDVDLETDSFDDVAELCRKRLDQMKKGVEMGVQDPMGLIQFIKPPISAVEPNQAQKAKWWAESLDYDELQESPMVLRAAVEMLAQGQITGELMQNAQLALGQGAVEAAGQAVPAMAQQAMQPQEQPEEPQLDPNQQLSAEADAQSQALQSVEADKAREHESTEAEKAHKREKEIKGMEQKGKLQLERVKARDKPKPTAGKKAA